MGNQYRPKRGLLKPPSVQELKVIASKMMRQAEDERMKQSFQVGSKKPFKFDIDRVNRSLKKKYQPTMQKVFRVYGHRLFVKFGFWDTIVRNLMEPIVGIDRYRVFDNCPRCDNGFTQKKPACRKCQRNYARSNFRKRDLCTKCVPKPCKKCDGTGEAKTYTTETTKTTSILCDLRDDILPIVLSWIDGMSKDKRSRLLDILATEKTSWYTKLALDYIYKPVFFLCTEPKNNKIINRIKSTAETKIQYLITTLKKQWKKLEVINKNQRRRLFPVLSAITRKESNHSS